MYEAGVMGIVNSFNPRTREGATAYDYLLDKDYVVSIHAPVRVRPKPGQNTRRSRNVSIHAPVRVRLRIYNALTLGHRFQSTHP